MWKRHYMPISIDKQGKSNWKNAMEHWYMFMIMIKLFEKYIIFWYWIIYKDSIRHWTNNPELSLSLSLFFFSLPRFKFVCLSSCLYLYLLVFVTVALSFWLAFSLLQPNGQHYHTRGSLSGTSRQIHQPRKQGLINRKRHRHTTNKNMDSYR